MRRPKFLILVSALVLALVIIFWPGRLPEPRDESKPTPQPPPAPLLSDLGKPAQLYRVAPASPGRVYEIDPANEQRADMLNSPDQGVQEDLQIVSEFVDLIHKAGVNASFGDNADITAALTGTQYAGQKDHLFPRSHPAIRGGQLVDRWGSPYWFHNNGPGKLEIRSAGPDKQLFTLDDIVRNPSPAGLGVTPEGAAP
mgnify:FL=1